MRSGLSSRSQLLRLAMTLAAISVMGILGACSSAPPDPKPAVADTAPPNPQRWVGRWHGGGAAALQIMPGGATGHYRLTLRSADGIITHYRATAADNRLIFNRAGRTLAIRVGRGNETDAPALAKLSDCLIVVPGRQGYCRRAGTADALPLDRGAYVAVKVGCRTARPIDILYFDGKGLTRAGQHACHASVVSQDGIVFHLSDSCAATSGTANGRPNETVTVPDPHDLSLKMHGQPDRLYRYCATDSLPPNLRSQAQNLR